MEESTHLSVKNTTTGSTVVERFGTPPHSQSTEPIIFNEIRGFRSMVRVRHNGQLRYNKSTDEMSCPASRRSILKKFGKSFDDPGDS